MKAKEYFQKYFEDLPVDITWNQFTEVATKCFQEFSQEQKQAMASVKQIEAKVTKIKEFYKKWQALGPMLAKKFVVIPEDYLRDIEQDGNQKIDRRDVFVISRLFDELLKKDHEYLYELVTDVKADRRYLPQEKRPSAFNHLYDRGDAASFLAMAKEMMNGKKI